jgi:hypothetical protein
MTSAGTPPIVTSASVVVCASGSVGAAAPVGGVFVTGPRPVAQIVTYSHFCAGRAAEKGLKGPARIPPAPTIWIEPCPNPYEFVLNKPGL